MALVKKKKKKRRNYVLVRMYRNRNPVVVPGGNAKQGSWYGKQVGGFSKSETELPYDLQSQVEK